MSNLIKDTTTEERIALIKQWVQAASDEGEVDNGLELWAMYDDYIKGKREISEINASLVKDYVSECYRYDKQSYSQAMSLS